uniref:NADH-ubiquinone oxidoreductase chain 3 n=1 Tax=Gonatocerus sp. ZCS-2018 TaxID=2305128 RepID=A0A346PZ42_9HYME|nr:NADH dehydrogenase subunit 3 [Gonatocerus sp. ZCS-2018]
MILNLFFLLMMFILIVFIMLFMNLLLSKKNFKFYEMMSSFECGFETQSNNRLPFSLQFYLIAIVFIIFDIEIALILPMIKLMNFNNLFLFINMIFIFLILIIGLLIEWFEGSLNWMK